MLLVGRLGSHTRRVAGMQGVKSKLRDAKGKIRGGGGHGHDDGSELAGGINAAYDEAVEEGGFAPPVSRRRPPIQIAATFPYRSQPGSLPCKSTRLPI